MDGFEVLYRVAFWALPAMLLTIFSVMVFTWIVELLRPVRSRSKRILVCPVSRREAGVEFTRSKYPGLPEKVRVIRCTELPEGPVLCDQGCLRLKDNKPLVKSADAEEEELPGKIEMWLILFLTVAGLTAYGAAAVLWETHINALERLDPWQEVLGHTPLSVYSRANPDYILTPQEFAVHYSPSGWMGDITDLAMSGYYRGPAKGEWGVVRITYRAKGRRGWAGIYWQHPPNNWSRVRGGGLNLKGAAQFTFWARGEKGGERIDAFRVGGITGTYPDTASKGLGPVTLGTRWGKYTIDLSQSDLSSIAGGFAFTVLAQDNPRGCVFYLNRMAFEAFPFARRSMP